ncbi:MAG: DUF262 domain-containing protein, partial [Hyphomicrobiaceae bacterium]
MDTTTTNSANENNVEPGQSRKIVMKTPFTAQAVTLEELFSGSPVLNVPDFQRSYSWTTTEAGQLLDDILEAVDATPAAQDNADPNDIFLGAIVLLHNPLDQKASAPATLEGPSQSGAQPRTFEIIDGLQRLITLTTLLAVSRDLAADDPETAAQANAAVITSGDDEGGDAQPRLRLPGAMQKFFWTYIQKPGASAEMPESETLSPTEERLLEVRELFLERL